MASPETDAKGEIGAPRAFFDPQAILNGTNPGIAPAQPSRRPETREKREPVASRKRFGPNDLFIAVMGLTGTGKSSFISLISDERAEIGHGLESHTSQIAIYPMKYNGKTIHLIDTPGFDDTYRQDIDVLKDIAFWLNKSYQEDLQLTGVIYLHRITDNRMGGTARKDLNMFKKLCGEESFQNVVLATTMWDAVHPRDGNNREQRLRTSPEFYGTMIQKGATMFRHTNDKNSAMNIVNFLTNKHTTTVLGIQKEMATGLSLDETAAGRELDAELLKQRKHFEAMLQENRDKMEAALKKKDQEQAIHLAEQQEELEKRLSAAQKVREDLKIDMEKLMAEKDEEFKKAMKQLENERKERDRAMRERERENEEFKQALREAEDRLIKREQEAKRVLDVERQNAQMQENYMMEANLKAAQAERARREAENARMRLEYMAMMANTAHQPVFYAQPQAPQVSYAQAASEGAAAFAMGEMIGEMLALGVNALTSDDITCAIM